MNDSADTLILASSSPRRKEILSSLHIPYISIHPEIDEAVYDHVEPAMRTVNLALAKASEGAAKAGALDFSGRIDSRLVLGADTLVAIPAPGHAHGWKVLGKPEDREEARRMTMELSGRMHRVFTGIALVDRFTGASWTALSDSAVFFSSIGAAELEAYLDTEEWEGAAGAYKLQGRAAFHIARIEGSWSGVMGLPIRELYDILSEADFRL